MGLSLHGSDSGIGLGICTSMDGSLVMKNADMPATPISNQHGKISPFTDSEGFSSMATGLTKREYFAIQALSTLKHDDYVMHSFASDMADNAVAIADALLAELDKDNGNG